MEALKANKLFWGYFAAIVSFFIWGGVSPIIVKSIALPGPVVSLIGLFFGCLFCFPFVLNNKKIQETRKALRDNKKDLWAISCLGSCIFIFSHLAYQATTIANAVLTFATMPFLTCFIFIPLYGGKTPGKKETISLLMGFLGLSIAFFNGVIVGPVGIVYAFGAALSFSWYNVILKNLESKMSSDVFVFLSMTLGLLFTVLVVLSLGFAFQAFAFSVSMLTLGNLLTLAIFGFINFALANYLYTFGAKNAPINHVATLGYSEPFWGILLGYLFFSEPITVKFFFGMILVLLSGYSMLNEKTFKTNER